MKSARELYDYAKDLQPKWDMSPMYFEPFIHQLDADEDVLFAMSCMGIENGEGRFVFGNGSGIIITNRRLILGGRLANSDSVFGVEELSFEKLERVEAVRKNIIIGVQPFIEVDDGRTFGFVLFDSRNAKRIGKTMHELVKQQRTSVQQNQTAVKQVSIADEIRKLKDLRDEGILSDEEFSAAKQKLLG